MDTHPMQRLTRGEHPATLAVMLSSRHVFALVSALCVVSPALSHAQAVGPHTSSSRLTTGNGYGFATFDLAAHRLNFFSNHPYASKSPQEDTLDFAFDAYFGVRAQGGSAWMGDVAIDEASYVEQSHIVRVVQHNGPLTIETYVWSPWGIEAPAVAMVAHVINTSRVRVPDGDVFALMNFHLGNGSPEAGANGERITWDATAGTFRETGPSGTTLTYFPLAVPTRHAASPDNPYTIVMGNGVLPNTADSGTRDDAVAGYQWSSGGLDAGAETWTGMVITTADPSVARTWVNNRAPQLLMRAELDAWNAWRVAPPTGLSAAENRVWRQSESVIRMAQSREPAPSRGQILASLPPGIWWISWVRDMSYALAALARSGHTVEANLGLDFLRDAPVGMYRSQVGTDYHVSVVRYYGNGAEWSDSNQDGPNVEFDGFGLALWAAHLAGRTDLDNNATSLRALTDGTGLIKADSSIWEVHWNGKEKHFGYTSITAANGLCRAGGEHRAAAQTLRDAIVRKLVLPTGGLAGNLEEMQQGQPARDAAIIEAINWGLISPTGTLATNTFRELERLRTPVGRGYMRNDDPDGYDMQEWVFVDLRVASALRRAGYIAEAEELLAWVTQQAEANQGLNAELYHRRSADYVGAVPMVGFGAGAYMLALMDRTTPETIDPVCFPATSETTSTDGGTGMTPARTGCSVSYATHRENRDRSHTAKVFAAALLFSLRRRARARAISPGVAR